VQVGACGDNHFRLNLNLKFSNSCPVCRICRYEM
jgi:hypothetical protein